MTNQWHSDVFPRLLDILANIIIFPQQIGFHLFEFDAPVCTYCYWFSFPLPVYNCCGPRYDMLFEFTIMLLFVNQLKCLFSSEYDFIMQSATCMLRSAKQLELHGSLSSVCFQSFCILDLVSLASVCRTWWAASVGYCLLISFLVFRMILQPAYSCGPKFLHVKEVAKPLNWKSYSHAVCEG